MMKKIIFMTFLFAISFILAACSENQHTSETVDKEEPTAEEKVENKNGYNEKTFHNEAFKDVTVFEDLGGIFVKGKARVFEGVFQYSIVSGDQVLMEETYRTAGAPAWGEFEFTIEKSMPITEDTKLELYYYSAKDGTKTDILVIPLGE